MRNGNLYSILLELFSLKIPGQIIIQINDHCNATCPQCGMNRLQSFKRSALDFDRIKKILDHGKNKGVRAVSFTGGEPLLFEDTLFNSIEYASKIGIKYTRTGTNGFFFMNHESPSFDKKVNEIAEKICSSNLYTFWISLDSWDVEKHEKNRGLPGVVKGIEKGLRIFEKYDLYPSVNLGINRLIETKPFNYYEDKYFNREKFYDNYREGLTKFFNFARDLGFTIANVCYPMSFEGAVYKAESSDMIVKYSNEEKKLIFKALYETIPNFRQKIRIFTPLSSLMVLMKQYDGKKIHKYACRGGKEFFFINTSGDTFPCGFLSDYNFGKFENIKRIDMKDSCIKCDWECFRDPSTLFAPLENLRQNPFGVFLDFIPNVRFYKKWLMDIFYYKKCGFFFMGNNPAGWRKNL